MKNLKLLFLLAVFGMVFSSAGDAFAQNSPVLYFCVKYGDNGEEGISDRFTTGYLTVMVKSADALGLTDCSIQLDKYDCATGNFKFFKKFKYAVSPDMNYVYFSRNEESDMNFSSPGIYRVFLLDASGNTVSSGLVEIVNQ